MHPKLIQIGDFFVPTYGVLVTTGFIAALWLSVRLAGRTGFDKEAVLNLGIYCGLAGILGGKVLFILADFDYYRRNPGEIVSFSTLQAGGIFYGGLLAALATAFIYMRRKQLPVLATADVIAPGLALGHGIGRLGCFMSGCCWGVECQRPWAVTFTDPTAGQMFGTPVGVPLHPAQLYEVAAMALTFVILYVRFGRPHRPGSIIGLYLVLYAGARFVIDFFRAAERPDPFGGPLSLAQWISVGLLMLGAAALTRGWRQRRA